MKVKGQVEEAGYEDYEELEDYEDTQDEHGLLLVVDFWFWVEFALQPDFGDHLDYVGLGELWLRVGVGNYCVGLWDYYFWMVNLSIL